MITPERTRTLILVACLGVAACSSTDGSHTTVTIKDSVREVVSHAPEPLPPPWRLIEEMSIGIDYGDEEYMLRRPLGLTVLEDGTIVVLDSNPLQLRLYDRDGHYIRAFGTPGSGPGDLAFSGSLATTFRPAGNGQFEIISGWPFRAQTWTTYGSLEEILTMPDNHPFLSGPRPRVLSFIEEDLFGVFNLYERLESGELIATTHLLMSDFSGSKCDTLLTFEGEYAMPPMAGMAQAAMGYTPEDAYLTTTAGRIFFSRLDEDWIHEVDPDRRRILMRFRWEHEADSIPQSLVENFTEQMGKSIGEGAAWLRENVYLFRLVEGPEEEIWVQRTGEPVQDGIYPTDIFRSDGIYRGRLQLPFAPRLRYIDGRIVYAISTTEGGGPTIVRYRLEETH